MLSWSFIVLRTDIHVPILLSYTDIQKQDKMYMSLQRLH